MFRDGHLARTADTATKGGAIAPRNEAGALTEAAGVLQNVPTIQDPRGRDGNDANPQRGAPPTQASSSDLGSVVFDFPAPGCPDKLPTYESVSAICKVLGEGTCDSNHLCSWSNNQCYPKTGTDVLSPEIDPAVAARFGLRDIDYAEPILASKYEIKGNTITLGGPAHYLARGDDYTESGQFQKAITEYTRVLKESPDFPQALTGRALAYERMGDKARAVRDYCRILVIAAHRERRNAAKARIAQLTGQETAASPSPSVVNPLNAQYTEKAARADVPQLKPVSSPPTSAIGRGRRRNAIAQLIIETESGTNYLVKFVTVGDKRNPLLIFINGGETYSTKIPLGTYNIRAAAGLIWYGLKDKFGPSTYFFRLRNKDGKQPTFVFYRQGNNVHGMKFSLKKVAEGNMEEESIGSDEF